MVLYYNVSFKKKQKKGGSTELPRSAPACSYFRVCNTLCFQSLEFLSFSVPFHHFMLKDLKGVQSRLNGLKSLVKFSNFVVCNPC